MVALALTYIDADSNVHRHSLRMAPGTWGSASVEDESIQETRFQAWAAKMKVLLDSDYKITSLQYINDIGAVVREHFPASPVDGTHSSVRLSGSATLGFVLKTAASGPTGRSKRSVSHIMLGHQDWHVAKRRRIEAGVVSAVDDYITYCNGNIALATVGGAGATMQSYATTQFNGLYQRNYGN